MFKEKLLISACLLGVPCRYDGAALENKAILALKETYDLVGFCPEVAGGLNTPRPPAELVNGRAQLASGKDVHAFYKKGAQLGLQLAKSENIKKAILKSKSPACGYGCIYDGSFSRKLTAGHGVFVQKLLAAGIAVATEHDFQPLLTAGDTHEHKR